MKRWGVLFATLLLFPACSDGSDAAAQPSPVRVGDVIEQAAPSLQLEAERYESAYRAFAETLGQDPSEADPLLGGELDTPNARLNLPRLIVACAWTDDLRENDGASLGPVRNEEGFDALASLLMGLTDEGRCGLLDANDVAILGRDVPAFADGDPAREALIGEVEALGAAFEAAVAEDQAKD